MSAKPPSPDPGPRPRRRTLNSCLPAIATAERQTGLPAKLLGTIALVESGRPDPVSGRVAPWPWTINVGGTGHFYATKQDAIAAVQDLQMLGLRSIDVGCMQINLMYHPNAFASLDEAFDPTANARYAARFLDALYRQTGNWPLAAAAYHSQTPDIGQDYENRVMALWPLAPQFAASITHLTRTPPSKPVDYSIYTPEFVAKLKQMDKDHARITAQLDPILPPSR